MKNKLLTGLLLLCFCPMMLSGQNVLSTLEDMHSVVKGETWESVAASYGISVAELQAVNPDVRKKKLKKKTLLIIPRSNGQGSNVKEPEPAAVSQTSTANAPLIRTSIANLKVGVLLPFSDKNMVEFYRGFLMAADSIRQRGVNIDIYAWDCGTTRAQVESLMPGIEGLEGLDVLVGPASAIQIPAVAETCREQGIRLVLPFPTELMLQDYPLVYNASLPRTMVYDAAVNKMVRYFGDKNYVIVRSSTPDNHGKLLTQTLTQSLSRQNVASKVLELEGDDFAYESAFNQFGGNMIIIDDSSLRSLNILTSRLKDFLRTHPQYQLSLVGYPEWQDETHRFLSNFFAFDTYIISPHYYNVLDGRTKAFQSTYEKLFRVPIAKNSPRYAAQGLDIGLYFLGGISSLGDTFEQMQGSIHQIPYQNWYQFERSASGISFCNRFVQFIHFTVDNKIELVR